MEQSEHWEERNELSKNFFSKNQLIPGLPFKEGLPKDRFSLYEIITADGIHHVARLDLSTQYRAEGIQWVTENGVTFEKQCVAAWRTKEA